MSDPLNLEGPTKQQVLDRVAAFLETPVEAEDGGASWPVVPDEVLHELYAVFSDILEAKFERDCDQDMVIEYAIGDRSKDSLMYVHIPHKPLDNIEQAMHSVSIASGIMEATTKRVCGSVQMQAAEERRKREWTEKCSNIVAAADGPLSGTRLETALVRWSMGDRLFTGYSPRRGLLGESDMWEPLGMTAKAVHEAYHDRMDRTQPFDDIEAACIALLTKDN